MSVQGRRGEGRGEGERGGYVYQHVRPASEMEMRKMRTGLITFIPTVGLGSD